MTTQDAMHRYFQVFQHLVETENLQLQDELFLESELDALAPFVHKKLDAAGEEHWRQQALAELHTYLMGEDVQLSSLFQMSCFTGER